MRENVRTFDVERVCASDRIADELESIAPAQ